MFLYSSPPSDILHTYLLKETSRFNFNLPREIDLSFFTGVVYPSYPTFYPSKFCPDASTSAESVAVFNFLSSCSSILIPWLCFAPLHIIKVLY